MTTHDLTTDEGTLAYLQSTQYAASDVQLLTGGRSAFVYRVTLKDPLPTGETTLILKHFEAYGAAFRQKKIFVERGNFEYKALTALAGSGLFDSNGAVQVPRPIHYDPKTFTIFMTDLGPLTTIAETLAKRLDSSVDPIEEYTLATYVGRVLGDFLGRFHNWSALPEQAQLRKDFLHNLAPETCLAFHHMCMTQAVSRAGVEDDQTSSIIERVQTKDLLDGEVLAMGDCFLNNVMISSASFGPQNIRLYILDWETSRPAPPELDIGVMTGSTLSFTCRYNDYPFLPALHKSYQQRRTLDPVRVATTTGMYALGMAPMMPWAKSYPEEGLREIRRTGFELLRLAHDGSGKEIREHNALKHLF
ncbi:hypothetical protein FRC12_014785 [Ceratobasidium sp. 428]|nr:hypothetical protein FRC12_014785 [Ceratobasidium sp. 428]